jgi:hypothetical protein
VSNFKPLHEVFDGRLKLPGDNGKTYLIPEPDEELGLWATAFCAVGVAANMGVEPKGEGLPPLVLDDESERAMYLRVLGPVWEELAADGYGFTTQKHFALTALLWIGLGQESAEAYWNSGGDPKASAPRSMRRNRQSPQQQSASTRSTDAASMTQGRVSTSGTTRRRQQRGR